MRIVTARPGRPVPEVVDLPPSKMEDGHARVRVTAAGINPVDRQVVGGEHAASLPPAEHHALGWDLAGEVLEVTDGSRFRPGDAVVGLIDWFATGPATGTQADEVVLLERYLVAAPRGVAPELAATLPLNATTAAQALDLLALPAGSTLVITGAAGAVGGFAVELAVARGLRVLALAREGDSAWLEARGATALVSAGDLSSMIRRIVPAGVDGLLDAAAIGQSAMGAVSDGGRFAILLGSSEVIPDRDVTVLRQVVSSDRELLATLVEQVDRGVLTPRVAEVVPLAEASRGYEVSARPGLRGQVILVP